MVVLRQAVELLRGQQQAQLRQLAGYLLAPGDLRSAQVLGLRDAEMQFQGLEAFQDGRS